MLESITQHYICINIRLLYTVYSILEIALCKTGILNLSRWQRLASSERFI